MRRSSSSALISTRCRWAGGLTASSACAVPSNPSSLPDTVATVGEINVQPGAKNVIPGECTFSVDIRAPKQESIDAVVSRFNDEGQEIFRRRLRGWQIRPLQTVPVTPLDADLRELLWKSAMSVGVNAPVLFSAAGHDAQNSSLSDVPTGMIFVRSTGGSHTPRESASIEDAVLGTRALELAIAELAS